MSADTNHIRWVAAKSFFIYYGASSHSQEERKRERDPAGVQGRLPCHYMAEGQQRGDTRRVTDVAPVASRHLARFNLTSLPFSAVPALPVQTEATSGTWCMSPTHRCHISKEEINRRRRIRRQVSPQTSDWWSRVSERQNSAAGNMSDLETLSQFHNWLLQLYIELKPTSWDD